MAAGEVDSVALHRGVEYLLSHQQHGGGWNDKAFTAPGFPRVFYLKYHGYSHYFPLWALARYRKLSLRDRAVAGDYPVARESAGVAAYDLDDA